MEKPPRAMVPSFAVTEGQQTYHVAELPTYCPRCGEDAVPKVLGQCTLEHYEEDPGWFYLNVPVKCPNCRNVFVAEYCSDIEPSRYESYTLSLISTSPRASRSTGVSDTLKTISKQFAIIYDQSKAAQDQGLNEIAGAGFRRALEFLVKDYLIHKSPGNREKYLGTPLRSCIKDHIQHETIRSLADRAASLGNDFVHYEAYEQRDVRELSDLIELTRRWVELQVETDAVSAREDVTPF